MELLFIDACISTHTPSRTKQLCDHYIKQYDGTGWNVTHLSLEELGLAPLTAADLALRDNCIANGDMDHAALKLAKQFAAADRIVIAAPYWDLSFPSCLRVYIEHIMVNTVAFRYGETGAIGLCRADKLVYITSAGGYVDGQNFGYDYLKGICGMVGIPHAECYAAQGMDIFGADVEQILQNTMDSMVK